jgi:hypothetical protein
MCSRENLGISFQNEYVELRCPIWKTALSGLIILKVNNARRFMAVRLVFFFLLFCSDEKCMHNFRVKAEKEARTLDAHV